MDQDRLKYLLDCYWRKQYTEAEKAELDEWFHANNPGGTDMDNWLSEAGGADELSDELYQDYRKRIVPPARVLKPGRLIGIAASLLLLLSVSYWFYVAKNQSADSQENLQAKGKNVIKPGGNKAVLTLANGEKIVLNDADMGRLAQQNSTQISKVADSSITYKYVGANDKKVLYNTMTTPRGGKYSLTLADGTEVMLDAASSIKFPVAFTGNERRVEVTGQAYFKVVHKADKPFYVVVKGQVIKDIGTEFNINAYDDEQAVRVTLAEGLVNVSNSKKTVSLVPGQQAEVINDQQNILIKTVNVGEVIAWKNGWFVFHHQSIPNVMRQAARWYDVDIAYEGKSITKKFGGNISKYKDITELLENLKITGAITNYKVEGRRVTLMN
jgi:transmembrane sensor